MSDARKTVKVANDIDERDNQLVKRVIEKIVECARFEVAVIHGFSDTEIPSNSSASFLPASAPDDIAFPISSDSSGCELFKTFTRALSCDFKTIAVAIAEVHPFKKLFVSMFFIGFLLSVISAVLCGRVALKA